MERKMKELKQGDFFTLKDISEPKDHQVWIKQEYDRSIKAYWCQCFADISKWKPIKPTMTVYTDFTF